MQNKWQRIEEELAASKAAVSKLQADNKHLSSKNSLLEKVAVLNSSEPPQPHMPGQVTASAVASSLSYPHLFHRYHSGVIGICVQPGVHMPHETVLSNICLIGSSVHQSCAAECSHQCFVRLYCAYRVFSPTLKPYNASHLADMVKGNVSCNQQFCSMASRSSGMPAWQLLTASPVAASIIKTCVCQVTSRPTLDNSLRRIQWEADSWKSTVNHTEQTITLYQLARMAPQQISLLWQVQCCFTCHTFTLGGQSPCSSSPSSRHLH